MNYRFYTTFPVEIDGVIIGTLEDVEAIAVIEVEDGDQSEWCVTGFKVIGTKGTNFGFCGGICEPIPGEIPLDTEHEADPWKERLRQHVRREFCEAWHAIEIERMLRGEAVEDGIDTVPQIEQDRSIYHQSVL